MWITMNESGKFDSSFKTRVLNLEESINWPILE